MKNHSLLLILGTFAAFGWATPVLAQPTSVLPPPPKAKALPAGINAEAKGLVNEMIARYQKLNSYSDEMRVELGGNGEALDGLRNGFPVVGKLSWERPARFRFEGTVKGQPFMALSDEKAIHVVNPEHSGYYIERLQNPPQLITFPDGHTKTVVAENTPRLDTALMETNVAAVGTAWMTEPEFWTHMMEDVTSVALEPDAEAGGEACRVVKIQAQEDANVKTLARLWIARSDGLLRRMELSNIFKGGTVKLTETHALFKRNPALASATWEFATPKNAKPIEYFSLLEPHKYDPTVKVGDALPVFSADALDGKPLELNPKSGKATLLVFFTLEMGPTELLSAQGIQKKVGADKLQVVAVVRSGRRERLEKFVADNKLSVPVYFEETATLNRMEQLFGVRQWTTTLLYDSTGKLAAIGTGIETPEMLTALSKAFPGETPTSLLNAIVLANPAPAAGP